MIFVTVGTQLPFDRLIKGIDEKVEELNDSVFCQIGEGEVPLNMDFCRWLNGEAYDELLEKADVVVSHAGMGTILTTLTQGKKVVIVPRQAALGEHRNDHQVATATHLSGLSGLYVADEKNIVAVINEARRDLCGSKINRHASQSVIDKLKKQIMTL